jgi:hypothetical protein
VTKKNQFIGVRFTKEEKEVIDNYVEKNEISYNDFIREAVLTYLNNLDTVKNKIDLSRIEENVNRFEIILPNLLREIHNLYKEFEEFKLNKNTYFILKK